jgi:hypothetical protein
LSYHLLTHSKYELTLQIADYQLIEFNIFDILKNNVHQITNNQGFDMNNTLTFRLIFIFLAFPTRPLSSILKSIKRPVNQRFTGLFAYQKRPKNAGFRRFLGSSHKLVERVGFF